ncbi:MAG: porin family protein [Acidobacteria bacterium]|nr:porin family protein [Acidobacteriota bacterium]
MKRIGAVLCLSLLAAHPSAAQTPRAEISGGYAVMRDQDRAETFPAGWVASVAGSINGWIGAAAEVGGSYRECGDCQRGPFTSATFRGTDRSLRVFSFMTGPRFTARGSRVTPFAQLLLGGSHISGGVQFDGALTTGFAYQPGAGIDVNVTPSLGLRVEGDYRVIRTEGHSGKASRVLAGVVWRKGRL